ncbi:hypothetical protein T08_15519 [Trichinella sp. T8]|nr:hypothetical protein T08_15519 [Trichinella sp. T8]
MECSRREVDANSQRPSVLERKKNEKKGGGFSGSEKKTIISATFPPVCPNSIGPLSSSTFVGWSSNVQSADTISSVKKMNEMTNDDNIIIQVKSD